MKQSLSGLRRIIRRSPFLYFACFSWKEKVRRLRAWPDSELIVEAFPRSANTTTTFSIFHANPGLKKVGHHLHTAAHVRYARIHKIPCLVIIRNPLDCVASLYIMRDSDPRLMLWDYIDFLKVSIEEKNHLVMYSFDYVVKNGVGDAIQAVNHKYGVNLSPPTGSNEEAAWVKEQIKANNQSMGNGGPNSIAIPNEVRKSKAIDAKRHIQEVCPVLLDEATELFDFAIANVCVK